MTNSLCSVMTPGVDLTGQSRIYAVNDLVSFRGFGSIRSDFRLRCTLVSIQALSAPGLETHRHRGCRALRSYPGIRDRVQCAPTCTVQGRFSPVKNLIRKKKKAPAAWSSYTCFNLGCRGHFLRQKGRGIERGGKKNRMLCDLNSASPSGRRCWKTFKTGDIHSPGMYRGRWKGFRRLHR